MNNSEFDAMYAKLSSVLREALQPTGTAGEQAFKAYILGMVGDLDNFHLQQRNEINHLGRTVENQKNEIARCYKDLEEVSVHNDEVFNDSMLQAGLEISKLNETREGMEKNPFEFNHRDHQEEIDLFLNKPATKRLTIENAQTACDKVQAEIETHYQYFYRLPEKLIPLQVKFYALTLHANQKREKANQKESMMRARVEFEKQQESDRLAFRQQQLSLQQEGGQSKRLRLDNSDALALENSREVRVLTLTHVMLLFV